MFSPSELAGDTPHTVRCNTKELISLMFCPSELAGDTPHTVRCYTKEPITQLNVLSIRTGVWCNQEIVILCKL